MATPVRTARRLIGWFSARPLTTDAIVAAVLGAISIVGYYAVEPEGSERVQDAFGLLLIVATVLGYSWRRRHPFAGFGVVVLATVVFWVADYPAGFEVISLLSVYSVVVHGGRDRRRVWIVAGLGVGVLIAVAVMGVLSEVEDLTSADAVAVSVVYATAAIIGEVVYGRQRQMRLLEARATRAEAEREVQAREAVLAERSRIARDLHDIVAHSMSVMVVQAGAAERLVTSRPELAAEALGQIQHTGREALGEMRRMLGVLRDSPSDRYAPQPTTADIGHLVEQCNSAGLTTTLTITGERPGHSAGAEIVAYRIAQEALTNVIKHGGPTASAAVGLAYTDDAIRLEVIDDGLGANLDATTTSTGHGLVGMRERIELFAGTLHVGPRPGGGFRIAATIPLDASAAGAPNSVVPTGP